VLEIGGVMTVHALHSKASIKGHPIHPMLVGFPIALYTTGVASLIAYAIQRDLFWYRGAMTLLFLGVGIALVAAVFGLVDLFLGVPREERATRNTGFIHLGLNVVTTLLFAGAAFSLYAAWRTRGMGEPELELAFELPLVLGIIALVLTFAAGAYGWKLVQTHHVGIEDPGVH
jgi:uncharacterized membrane protein